MVKLPKGRTYQLNTDLDMIFDGLEDIPYGPRWLGMKIRKGEYHVELGGPKNEYKSYLYMGITDNVDEIEDGKFELIGPDMPEIEPGSSFPVGIDVRAWGEHLTDEYTEYFDRTLNGCWDYIEDVMLINARNTIWIRVGKGAAETLTFPKIAQLTYAILKTSMPLVEKVQIQMIIGSEEVGGLDLLGKLSEEYEKRWDILDARYQDLRDEDVDVFYGCTICQTFAPNHVCVISPERMPYCGILSYNGAKIGAQIDPHGYVFTVEKGECLDDKLGIYSGANEIIFDKSNMSTEKVSLYSCLHYPQTNCGCFECSVFYIPQLDGVGVVSRAHFGDTPLGIPFSRIAAVMSGGGQNDGFMGTSVRAMRQRKFLFGDGGYERVVWLNDALKTQVAEAIPEEIYDRIPTEKDAVNWEDIKKYLIEKEHPIIERYWVDGEPVPQDLSE